MSTDQNPDENTSFDRFEKCYQQGFPGFCLKDSEVISRIEGWQWGAGGVRWGRSLLLIQMTALKDFSFQYVYHAWEVTKVINHCLDYLSD